MRAKVLIVDDNPSVLALLRANLRASGFATAEAPNGQVALEKIELEQPDLILLDLMLPVIDGWAVLERLKDRKDLPPVVVISAVDSPADIERAQQLGVTSYLTKPLDLVGLVELVQSVTDKAAPGGAPEVGHRSTL